MDKQEITAWSQMPEPTSTVTRSRDTIMPSRKIYGRKTGNRLISLLKRFTDISKRWRCLIVSFLKEMLRYRIGEEKRPLSLWAPGKFLNLIFEGLYCRGGKLFYPLPSRVQWLEFANQSGKRQINKSKRNELESRKEMGFRKVVRWVMCVYHFRLNKGKGGWGLLDWGGELWEGEGRKCTVNKVCLVMWIRVSWVIRVVLGHSSFPGQETFTNGNLLYKCKFPI